MRSVRTRPAAALLAAAVLWAPLAAACKKDHPKPTPTTADPDEAARAARGRLAVLAQATANGAYDATYTFVQQQTRTTGQIRIRQRPPQYRIDVVTKDTASFFALTSGVVSCAQRKAKKTCFLVAKPGEEVPPLFDPGVQHLFRDAVTDLAAHPTDYDVTVPPLDQATAPPTTTAPPPTAGLTLTPSATPTTGRPSVTPDPPPVPAGECFLVHRLVTPSPGQAQGGFEDGTYCFAEDGVATRVEVASGTLTLVRVGPDPDAAAFKPYAKVEKLPELTPAPTPSKK